MLEHIKRLKSLFLDKLKYLFILDKRSTFKMQLFILQLLLPINHLHQILILIKNFILSYEINIVLDCVEIHFYFKWLRDLSI